MTTHVVVMGVSGSGKTTVAQGIVDRTGWVFAEADEFHPRANIDKMASGTPLTDEDRWPWLRDLAAWMAQHAARGEDTVITCSALKRVYRDVLRADVAALGDGHRVVFAHLDGSAEVIAARIEGRKGHFMPASLLQSQIDTLEDLQDDEDGVVLDATTSPQELIDQVMADVAPGR
ncbi:gluconokinase [Janibacter limosus]|jgi:carbohydrate kinase (thermoresistant glucokinase family)|uniref:gluconokinase n=1 Tax=Janibacter limosus TaxID=53458 RepID=UPI000836F534|nr:gluconokinase [Janibacter limosus]